MHLDNAKNKIDLTKTITTYDRFYNSIEIMFKTMLLDSYFIIRGKTHTFKKQQNKMKKEGKTDETHEINIKKSTNQQFFHRRSKKIRKKNTRNKSQNRIRHRTHTVPYHPALCKRYHKSDENRASGIRKRSIHHSGNRTGGTGKRRTHKICTYGHPHL